MEEKEDGDQEKKKGWRVGGRESFAKRQLGEKTVGEKFLGRWRTERGWQAGGWKEGWENDDGKIVLG